MVQDIPISYGRAGQKSCAEAEKAQYSEPRLVTGMARMGMVKVLVHRMSR